MNNLYKISSETMYKVAHLLKCLNESPNNNKQRISCLDTVIFYLEHNDIRRAKNTISNEWDKISSHKDVVECLKAYNLLPSVCV